MQRAQYEQRSKWTVHLQRCLVARHALARLSRCTFSSSTGSRQATCAASTTQRPQRIRSHAKQRLNKGGRT